VLAEGEELGSNLLRVAQSSLWIRAVPGSEAPCGRVGPLLSNPGQTGWRSTAGSVGRPETANTSRH
jgi:hypothetical protein